MEKQKKKDYLIKLSSAERTSLELGAYLDPVHEIAIISSLQHDLSIVKLLRILGFSPVMLFNCNVTLCCCDACVREGGSFTFQAFFFLYKCSQVFLTFMSANFDWCTTFLCWKFYHWSLLFHNLDEVLLPNPLAQFHHITHLNRVRYNTTEYILNMSSTIDVNRCYL